MPEIRPFTGIRYAPSHLSAGVLAPPFDVIDEEQRRALAERSPHNVVVIDKGPVDHGDEWYALAAAVRDRWLEQGVLLRDPTPGFYGYRQSFSMQGQEYTRTGFVAAVRLAPWGQGVHPHERTRTGDRADRLKLTRALHANMSPVFGLYSDTAGTLDRFLEPPEEPLLDEVPVDGVRHTFWRIDDAESVEELRSRIASRDIVIADGHHRYETALAYQAEMRSQQPLATASQAWDYVMMYLTNADAPGLVILPTHRLVNKSNLDQEALLHSLGSQFEIYPLWDHSQIAERLRSAAESTLSLAMYTRDMGNFMLKLKAGVGKPSASRPQGESLLEALDVVALQERILCPLLGISQEDLAASAGVTYTTDADVALREVREGRAELAFILNPTTTEQVWRAATTGLFMPQKSTYFYPKLLTGLVFNPLDDPR